MQEPPRSSEGLAADRVLVTGASGLIGSHLCQRLARSGVRVWAVSRAGDADGDGPVRRLQGDLSEPDDVRAVLDASQPTVVFHLAGLVAGDRSRAMVSPTLRHNLLATVNLLEAVADAGCRRLVVAGSLLEEPRSGSPDAVAPSPYGVSKWAASAYVRTFHALYDLPAVILRPSMAYGPAQRDLRKVVPYVTLALLRGESPRLTSAQREVDWVFASDVAEAFVAAADAPGVEGATIDIGSGELVSVRSVVERLAELVGGEVRPQFGAVATRPLEQEIPVDADRAAALLGWRATTPLDEGLRRTVAWYARQPARR